ncbi:HlyD family efflux transporter periplasmic adaptor subunit [Paludicola sp. MB14-C6]|uniref:efflux RND transporter periplasmic adaptor subunit n=1 Tax=Paludihabitans sp. MB14-C6 TaxID=3070656 RepID=UPI0027DCE188|nr:HlyD family efflux transporter periplasmic adaptor subunit [Paludicola sp. MB14-C6]WMJ22821.1 HlyD family efflux transporter periplasmic adaptor subunit [Paludicola sp. MB14-C6]
MKKYVIMQAVAIPMFILALFIPVFITNSVIPVEVTTVSQANYTDDIYVNGFVEEKSKKDIFANLPLVPSKVNFRIGDKVNAGDVIAEIDTDATKNALLQLANMANFIPKEYVDAIGKLNVDEKIIKDYIPTEMTAPISGTITSISLVEGAISTPNTSVVTIIQADENRVKMSVNESDIDKVKVGDTVVFKANATKDVKYVGKVERVFPTATKTLVGTTQATVVGIYVDLAENYDKLRPGYTVNGVIHNADKEVVHIIPYEAVLQDAKNKEYVYVIRNSHAERCYIETGRELGDGIEILSPSLFDQAIVKNANDIKRDRGLVKIVKK